MRYVRYEYQGETSYGLCEGDAVRRLAGDLFANSVATDVVHAAADCRLLAPCQPRNVIGIGRNYRHLFATPEQRLRYPMLFLKSPTSVVGPFDVVEYPSAVRGTIFEVELALVIGRKAVEVSEDESLKYVFGYTCLNDISSREYWPEGLKDSGPGDAIVKACDNFAPMGPCIRTDLDPGNVMLRSWLNGQLKQEVNTSDLVFGPAALVSYVSRFITLWPGDVITTGTPKGFEVMRPGDTIECEAEGIGRQHNAIRQRGR